MDEGKEDKIMGVVSKGIGLLVTSFIYGIFLMLGMILHMITRKR